MALAVTGRPVVRRDARAAVGGWVSSSTAIAAGAMSTVSDTVPRLTGPPAETLQEWLARTGS